MHTLHDNSTPLVIGTKIKLFVVHCIARLNLASTPVTARCRLCLLNPSLSLEDLSFFAIATTLPARPPPLLPSSNIDVMAGSLGST
jgi:hypothetical protein